MQDAFGFDVYTFLKKVKDENGLGKIRLLFDNDTSRAHAMHVAGVCEIHLPTRQAIKQLRGFDEATAVAKQKAGLIEEVIHCKHREASHTDTIVSETIQSMQRHLAPQELMIPYIQEKIRRLVQSPERVQSLAPLPQPSP